MHRLFMHANEPFSCHRIRSLKQWYYALCLQGFFAHPVRDLVFLLGRGRIPKLRLPWFYICKWIQQDGYSSRKYRTNAPWIRILLQGAAMEGKLFLLLISEWGKGDWDGFSQFKRKKYDHNRVFVRHRSALSNASFQRTFLLFLFLSRNSWIYTKAHAVWHFQLPIIWDDRQFDRFVILFSKEKDLTGDNNITLIDIPPAAAARPEVFFITISRRDGVCSLFRDFLEIYLLQ